VNRVNLVRASFAIFGGLLIGGIGILFLVHIVAPSALYQSITPSYRPRWLSRYSVQEAIEGSWSVFDGYGNDSTSMVQWSSDTAPSRMIGFLDIRAGRYTFLPSSEPISAAFRARFAFADTPIGPITFRYSGIARDSPVELLESGKGHIACRFSDDSGTPFEYLIRPVPNRSGSLMFHSFYSEYQRYGIYKDIGQ